MATTPSNPSKPISLDRLRANQRNAQKSTGPRTEAGKARSRANALKHGLAGQGIVLPAEELAKVEKREADWAAELAPRSRLEAWFVKAAALASVRLERGFALELGQRERLALRAAVCWDEDRRREAERLGARLARDPAVVRSQLRETRHGCDWLIARWEALGRALRLRGSWTEAERAAALDLLGIPPLEREFDPTLPLDAPTDALLGVVQAQLDDLAALKADALDDLDAFDRDLARSGLDLDVSPPARLLRRYEAGNRTLLFWGLGQLARRRRPQPGGPPRQPGLTTKPPAPTARLAARVQSVRQDEPPAASPSLCPPAPAPGPVRPPRPAPARPEPQTAAVVPPDRPDRPDLSPAPAPAPKATEPMPIRLANLLRPTSLAEAARSRLAASAPAPAQNRRARRAQKRLAGRDG